VKTDGKLMVWGYNSSGQLGNGETASVNSPLQIETENTWLSAAAGYYHTLAIRSDHTLWAWGQNYNGQLGNGNIVDSHIPVEVVPDAGNTSGWESVSAGYRHTLAVRIDGTLWAWGYNRYGQLGDGTNNNSSVPIQIGEDTTWSMVAAGSYYSLAMKDDGSLWAWGSNSRGQVGDGTTMNVLSPVRVVDGTLWQTVSGGGAHTMAVLSDGTLWAWGSNSYGELGDGDSWSAVPVQVFVGHLITVTSAVTGNGSITPTPTREVTLGGKAQFTLTPDTSNLIAGVSGTCPEGMLTDNGDGSWQYTTGALAVACSVTADFSDTAFLNYASDANGSITGTLQQIVAYGENGTSVTAVPDAGFVFVKWSDGLTAAERIETNVVAGISVTAYFSDTPSLQYGTSANGTVVGELSQSVGYGEDGAAVSAVANAGYRFTGWSDGILTPTRTETNVTANIAVTANFAADSYILTYTAEANGTLDGEASQTVTHGADGTPVTAQAADNYHFVDWDDGKTSAARTELSVSADISVVARFALNTYTVTSTVPGGHGTIDPSGEQDAAYGAILQFLLTPATGYRTAQVTGSCGGILSGDTFTTNAVSTDCTVEAAFILNQYLLSVLIEGEGTGSVSSNPPGINTCTSDCSANFAPTDVVTLTAEAGDGSNFTGWSGEGCSGTGDCIVTMDQARDVTAEFSNSSGFPWIMFMPAITGMHP
jgi:hypothetical protein